MSELSINIRRMFTDSTNSAGEGVKRYGDASIASTTPFDQETELALMQRLAKGDENAMHQFIEQYGTWLKQLVGRLVAWSPDHEDVFQDLLLLVWQKAGQYQAKGPLSGWLRRMAINQCHNYARRQNSIRQKLQGLFEFKSHATNQDKHAETSSSVQAALARLSQQDRTLLVLYYLEDLGGRQTAIQLGMQLQTLHVRLHRARKRLKTFLVEGKC